MAELRCALAVLPAENGDPDRLLRSLDGARAAGLGDFSEITPVAGASSSAPAMLARAAEEAAGAGSDWLLAVSAAETLAPDIFVKTAPALRLHDAVWGGAELAATGKLERITRLPAQDVWTFCHAALGWWIGPAHFVRPAAALRALGSVTSPSWYAEYLFNLWTTESAYKTAQALTVFHQALPPFSGPDREWLIARLGREPVFMPVRHASHTLHLPYTGLNPVIEREQARGLFFEDEELRFLAGRVPRGSRIVDAGANTGNHTLFFAAVMAAEHVIPIEPDPRAAMAVRAVIARNSLRNVDTASLGVAVGAASGRLKPIFSATGGLGATRLAPDPDGAIQVLPLDDLVAGKVDFIKIDVEGMEMDVLAGAARLLSRHRPLIYIEVMDATAGRFMAWADANSYCVRKLFPDKAHCNYFLVPAEHAQERSA